MIRVFLSCTGSVCLPILRTEEAWKVSVFLDEILEKVLDVIDHPNLNVPINDGWNSLFLFRILDCSVF